VISLISILFFFKIPLAPLRRGVTEVPICRYGRIFLTVATGADATALTPCLSYTVEEATVGRCRLNQVDP
jgi:hypothetical protein